MEVSFLHTSVILVLLFLCRTYYINEFFPVYNNRISKSNYIQRFFKILISGEFKALKTTLAELNLWWVHFSIKLNAAFSVLIIAFQHLFP